MGVTGFVLAGGASSRMGRDKSRLLVGRQTLIERVIGRLRPHVERLVVVIGRAHDKEGLGGLPVDDILADLQPGQGPLMAVYTGLLHSTTALNLFAPCDMPWIEGRLIARLTEECRGAVEVVASEHPAERVQPFPLLCQRTAYRTVQMLLERKERSLQALLRHPTARRIRIQDQGLWASFTNVNTPADYAKLCEKTALAP